MSLEPRRGDYDQSFTDSCYTKLKDFSLNSMEDVLSFCDKTIKETNTKINQTEGILKQQLGKNEYEEIQKEIKSNDASTKNILHQRKLKISNNLKHKPKAQIKATTIKETENKEKPTYCEKNPETLPEDRT